MLHSREDGGEESSEESVNDEEDDEDDDGAASVRMLPPNPPPLLTSAVAMSNHRKSFPPPAKVFRTAPTWKAADEMIGVSVPRKARSGRTVERWSPVSVLKFLRFGGFRVLISLLFFVVFRFSVDKEVARMLGFKCYRSRCGANSPPDFDIAGETEPRIDFGGSGVAGSSLAVFFQCFVA